MHFSPSRFKYHTLAVEAFNLLCTSLIPQFPNPSFLLIFFMMNSMGMRYFFGLPIIGFILVALSQFTAGQGVAPSPAPIAPSNDGTAIDQGIAYVLLLVALAITYLIH